MLKSNKDGLYFVSLKTRMVYNLEMGTTIGLFPCKTSDKCFILSTGLTEEEYDIFMQCKGDKEIDEKIVGWFYGASFLIDNQFKSDYVRTIQEFVEEYENRTYYQFTLDKLGLFYENIEDDALKELSKMQNVGRVDQDNLDINIRVGNHCITIPYTDDNYIRLNNFILDCRAETVDIKIESKVKDNMKASTNYVIKEIINNSCYPETFQNVFKLLYTNNIDGWDAMEFLNFLYKRAKDAEDKYYETHVSTDIYFVIYNKGYEDEKEDYIELPSIEYGENLEHCLNDPIKISKFYKIGMTEDCFLAEIVPKCKTIDEEVLDTLLAYKETNKDVLSVMKIQSLDNQIEYMREKIKEDG